MSDSSRAHEHEIPVKLTNAHLPGLRKSVDSGRTVLVGVLGGIASAVGYAVYQKLPDEQRDRLHEQVRSLVASRLNEFRANFNL